MVRKKSARDLSHTAEDSQVPAQEQPFTDPRLVAPLTRSWLTRFLLGLAATFAALALVFSVYNLWIVSATSTAQQSIAKGDLTSLTQAVATLSSPHLFAGYEPYHGFGRESAGQFQRKAEAILASHADYAEADLAFLIHRPDHYLAAWSQERNDQNPPVPGDTVVLTSIVSRQLNAVSNTWVFIGYFVIVAGLMATVYLIYRRRWRRGV